MPLRPIFPPRFWNAVNLFAVHFLRQFPEKWQFTKGARLINLSWGHSCNFRTSEYNLPKLQNWIL